MITSWYIIYENFGGKYLGIVDAINQAEAEKILGQQVVVMGEPRCENMHKILTPAEKETMQKSFEQTKTTKP